VISFTQVSPQNLTPTHTFHLSRLSHPSWLDHPAQTWWRVQLMKIHIMQSSPVPICLPSPRPTLCSLLRSPFVSPVLDQNVFFSSLFWNPPTPPSVTPSVWETKLHTNIKHRKVVVLYILTFWHRSFTFNSNKSPTWCISFSVYYPDVCLHINMFRAFSRPSSEAQWLPLQSLSSWW